MNFELRKDAVNNPERLDILRIQMKFSTSYSATLTRLKELGLISRFHERCTCPGWMDMDLSGQGSLFVFARALVT
jgi:hypothetical protein